MRYNQKIMKIVCLLSKGKGHIDFGGMGYLKIAKALREEGNEVIFYTAENQVSFIESQGFKCIVVKNIDWLWLYRDDYDYSKGDKNFYIGLKFIELSLQKEKPDLVLVDRILGLAGGMLEHLKIPYISIGTPGGNWRKVDKSILPELSEHNHNGTKELFIERLHWPFKELSAWCNSPYLNIVFMGKEFYPNHHFENTLFVNHFNYNFTPNKEEIGLSLGSGTFDNEKMLQALINACQHLKENQKLKIYGKDKITDGFFESIPKEYLSKIEMCGFVDFKVEMQKLKYLIFPGGIGSLWYCIDNNVMPIIVSGEIHDQNYNDSQSRFLKISGKIGDESKIINPSSIFSFNSDFENTLKVIETGFN